MKIGENDSQWTKYKRTIKFLKTEWEKSFYTNNFFKLNFHPTKFCWCLRKNLFNIMRLISVYFFDCSFGSCFKRWKVLSHERKAAEFFDWNGNSTPKSNHTLLWTLFTNGPCQKVQIQEMLGEGVSSVLRNIWSRLTLKWAFFLVARVMPLHTQQSFEVVIIHFTSHSKNQDLLWYIRTWHFHISLSLSVTGTRRKVQRKATITHFTKVSDNDVYKFSKMKTIMQLFRGITLLLCFEKWQKLVLDVIQEKM